MTTYFCNVPLPFNMCDVGILCPYISDHHAIFCILKTHKSPKVSQSFTKRNLCEKNIARFNRSLQRETWDLVYTQGTQKGFTWFQRSVNLLFDKFFNKQTYPITYRNRYLWMTNELRAKIMEKNKLGQQVSKNTNDLKLCKLYKQLKNEVTSTIRNTEITFYSNELETHKNDISKSWEIFKTIIGKKNHNCKQKFTFLIDDSTVTDSQQIANEFNTFFVSIGRKLAAETVSTVSPLSYVKQVINSIFIQEVTVRTTILSLKNSSPGWDEFPTFIAKRSIDNYIIPLTHIVNKCFSEGVFPSELKLAKVVPIFKAGASNKITNFRPISVLSFFSKVFEKIIYNHLIDFMNHNDILYGYQFGFRKGHSTQQAIITLVNKIISCLDNGDLVLGVFLDLKKAFDTVDHKILLKKLYAYGVRDVALKLLESYLSDRYQYVVYDNQKSETLSITCGVPQGSIL